MRAFASATKTVTSALRTTGGDGWHRSYGYHQAQRTPRERSALLGPSVVPQVPAPTIPQLLPQLPLVLAVSI